MSVKLLTEHHLEFLSLKGGCVCLSESTLVKMPHCWKSHVTAHMKRVHTSVRSFLYGRLRNVNTRVFIKHTVLYYVVVLRNTLPGEITLTQSIHSNHWNTKRCLFVWNDSLRPINNFSVKKGRVFLGWIKTKLGLMFLLKDTTQWRRWGSNPGALGLQSSTLPMIEIYYCTALHVYYQNKELFKANNGYYFLTIKRRQFLRVFTTYVLVQKLK